MAKTKKRKLSTRYVKDVLKADRRLAFDTVSRVKLGNAVVGLANNRGLSRDDMALIVGDAASQMSRLMRGNFAEFSHDRLLGYYTKLGGSIHIELTPPMKRHGRVGRGRVRINVHAA